MLQELLHNHRRYIEEQYPFEPGLGHPSDEQFMAEMNALVVRDAEEYYRLMLTEDAITWNLRYESLPCGMRVFRSSYLAGMITSPESWCKLLGT